jgi:hypothetical protein
MVGSAMQMNLSYRLWQPMWDLRWKIAVISVEEGRSVNKYHKHQRLPKTHPYNSHKTLAALKALGLSDILWRGQKICPVHLSMAHKWRYL